VQKNCCWLERQAEPLLEHSRMGSICCCVARKVRRRYVAAYEFSGRRGMHECFGVAPLMQGSSCEGRIIAGD